MCGRVILTLSAKMIEAILNGTYDVEQLNIDDFLPRYNIGPSQKLLSIIEHKGLRRAGYMDWNYIPSFSKEPTSSVKIINARSETIHEKPSFKDAFISRRCLVICNGFYEWRRKNNLKTPFFFSKDDMDIFALAGIWNPYMTSDGLKSYGISLITTQANELMMPIHHRMPVIIKPKDTQIWLNNNSQLPDLQKLMSPIEKDYLQVYEVSSHVNNVKNNDKKCIEKVS